MAALPGLTPGTLPPGTAELRARVREFLAGTPFTARCDSWLTGADPAFSRLLGERGWLGMTLPERYGGHGRSPLERFVVVEELLAAGAPVGAHWIADRQTGPSILAHGTEEQKARFLPAIARGECFFAIGMSEPDSGSDLASVRTRAERDGGGWRLHGAKVWTSGAHLAHAILVLARSAPRSQDRHAGLSQFIVPLPDDRVTVRPIRGLSGEHHFNEVVLDGVFVPDALVLGRAGDGWRQVTAELAHERSGPERLLSTFMLIRLLHGRAEGPAARRALGGLIARLWALRQASLGVAGALARGETPELAAALVKDLGTRFEREVIEVAREHAGVEPDPGSADPLARALAESVVQAPGFTLRGGTNEILRGIVARGLGVR
ncbi:acyl-CoA dehydrogenase family protein [Actinomadura sp. NPDC048955]|uniref:Alkylation response protein AidB-like acyl-CoA dehydrogenase n=1 Tax=Actinomadura luteofluorescens TaxID=46163 RepID=A0A7Y9ECZ3_9ACTN|nr:acyl-CoA dehydrogenase family protein [Actinomadura luteofluorescens]NYD45302.1 alkylation response protein AidB-like acyl-CoA dehydrogenase [Actinomadura luteofluorescens]